MRVVRPSEARARSAGDSLGLPVEGSLPWEQYPWPVQEKSQEGWCASWGVVQYRCQQYRHLYPKGGRLSVKAYLWFT